MRTPRTILAPAVDSEFSAVSKKVFWKQILPQSKIHYKTVDGKEADINFNEKYLLNLAKAFNAKALDQTPFMLAGKDNAHTMDPERWRGEVAEVRLAAPGEKPGLYGKFVFPSAKAAKAVIRNPALGVSARIREGVTTSDGRKFPAAMIHVLGTLDPQVTGMDSWKTADLSAFLDNVLDLSNESFSERLSMAKGLKPAERTLDSYTLAEIDAMSDEELAEFFDVFELNLDPTEDEDDEEDDFEDDDDDENDFDEEDEEDLVGAGAELSNKAKHDIQLANERAAAADARAAKLERKAAKAEWEAYRDKSLAAGVPPYLLDLAEPVLNRPEAMVIDLSNSDEEDVPVSDIVRKMIDGAKGYVDLSYEQGHYGSTDDNEDDPDQPVLDSWELPGITSI